MERHVPGRTVPLVVVNLGTLVVAVLWLVAAGFALSYLLSH